MSLRCLFGHDYTILEHDKVRGNHGRMYVTTIRYCVRCHHIDEKIQVKVDTAWVSKKLLEQGRR